MAETTWLNVSENWNDPASWSDGVPTSVDDAYFNFIPTTAEQEDVTGDGPASSININGYDDDNGGGSLGVIAFTGAHNVLDLFVDAEGLRLGSTASLSFQTAGMLNASLEVDAGATFSSGAVTLDGSIVVGTLGELTNAFTLADTVTIDGSGTISGAIGGGGVLTLGADETAASPSPFVLPVLSLADLAGYSGSIVIEDAEVAFTGSISGGSITSFDNDTISAASASLTVFQGQGGLTLDNGSGHATVIGEVGVGAQQYVDELGPDDAGRLSVDGGTGSLTVFGNDDSGTIIGGAAGGNILVGGAIAAGDTPQAGPGGFWKTSGGDLIFAPQPVTIEGGGNGDLLVVTGVLNNEIAAAGGNETLTGSTATGDNTFFSGSGADEIVAGGGQDTVVGTGGSSTVFGGTGGTAVFTGPGVMEVVGGKGMDYVQVGQGAATLFTGVGTDVIGVVNGASGGSLTVVGFRPGIDQFDVQRYTLPPTVTAAAGGTVLTFQDHTSVTLVGIPPNLI